MEALSTRDKILRTSILLFSEKGFGNVSMRDIAAKVGIQAASIYNHFPSKHDILVSIYKFYAEEQRRVMPAAEDLLLLAEIEHPHVVLRKLLYTFPPELQETMERIIMIAGKGIGGESQGENERFLSENLFGVSIRLLIPLLNRMIELNKIEAIDVEGFAYLATYFGFSAAVLTPSNMKIDPDKWVSGWSMIISLIKPVEKTYER